MLNIRNLFSLGHSTCTKMTSKMILFHLICPAWCVNNYRFITQQIFSTAYNTTLSCVVIFNHAVNTIGRKKNDCLFVSTWIKILHMCLCYPILQGSNRYNTKWPCFKSPLHWKTVSIERPPPLGWVTSVMFYRKLGRTQLKYFRWIKLFQATANGYNS